METRFVDFNKHCKRFVNASIRTYQSKNEALPEVFKRVNREIRALDSIVEKIGMIEKIPHENTREKLISTQELLQLLDAADISHQKLKNDLNDFKNNPDNAVIYDAGYVLVELLNHAAEILNPIKERYQSKETSYIPGDFYPRRTKEFKDKTFKITKTPVVQSSQTSALTQLLRERKSHEHKEDPKQQIEKNLLELRGALVKRISAKNKEIQQCAAYISNQIREYESMSSTVSPEELKALSMEVSGFTRVAAQFLEFVDEIKHYDKIVEILKIYLQNVRTQKEEWNVDKIFVVLYENLHKDDHYYLREMYKLDFAFAQQNLKAGEAGVQAVAPSTDAPSTDAPANDGPANDAKLEQADSLQRVSRKA